MEELMKFLAKAAEKNESLKTGTDALDQAIEKDSKALQAAIDKATAAVEAEQAAINGLVSQGRLVESGPRRLQLDELKIAAALARLAFYDRQLKYDSDRAALHGQASVEMGQMVRQAEEKANDLSQLAFKLAAELRRSYDLADNISRNYSAYNSPNARKVAECQAEIDQILALALV